MEYIDLNDALEKLERAQRELDWRVDELADKAGTLDERIESLETDTRLQTLDERVDELAEHSEEHGADLTEARAVLKTLAGRIDWLEHHLRAAEGLQPVDLDDLEDSLRALVRQARTASKARSALLTNTERNSLTWRINSHDTARARLDELIDQALAHSKTLAETTPGEQAHNEAATAFRTAYQQATTQSKQVTDLKRDRDQAEEELAADDARKKTHGPKIMTGENAREVLRARLRERITQHVIRRDLLPVWFTTALGYGPPAADTETWMDAATALLTYRITYDINDPISALGPKPRTGEAEHEQRRASYYAVSSKINTARNWP